MTSGSAPSRPVPVPDELGRPLWDAAAEHRLALARCLSCGQLSHPPTPVCPHCRVTEARFEFTEVVGTGTVRSWTVVRQSFLPGLAADVPYVLVDVELDAQPELRLIGRLLDGPDQPLHAGAAVRLAFEDIGADVSVPAFQLESPA